MKSSYQAKQTVKYNRISFAKKIIFFASGSSGFFLSFFYLSILLNEDELYKYNLSKENEALKSSLVNEDGDEPPADYFSKKQNVTQLSAVQTSNDNFDNYYLGVCFAEPHIAQNPNNPLQYFVAYNYDQAFYTNNGYDWTSISPNFGVTTTADPVTAYDNNGNLYFQLLWNIGSATQGSRIMKSTDNGATWVNSVSSGTGSDKNWVTADQTGGPYNGRLYSSIVNSTYDGIVITRSTDSGASWQVVKSISQSNPFAGTMIAVGPNGVTNGGSVYLATNYGDVFAATYDFYLSTDGGSNWTLKSHQTGATGFVGYAGTSLGGKHSINTTRTRPVPYIAVDNSNGTYRGRLYLAYTTNNPAGNGNKPDIYFRYSTNQGTSWSAAKTVNDDVNSENNFNWFPYLYCDAQTGRILITWLDTRDDPGSDSANVYATYSDDGGQTFQPNVRLSNKTMLINCTTCGGTGTPRYQGDYNSVVSLNGQGMATWTYFNSVNGRFDAYVSYFPDYSMKLSNSNPVITEIDDEINIYAKVPAVKLYTDNVTFSYSISPSLPSGLEIDFPDGATLSSYPDSVKVRIKTGSTPVPVGGYTITIKSTGPNGTPVHKRTTTLTVQHALPVEMTSFVGEFSNGVISLKWITVTEVNNYGFDVERKINNGIWQKIAFVDGNGNSNSPKIYNYSDSDLLNKGDYHYCLKQIDNDGTFKYSKEIVVNTNFPDDYELYQNYPNPFNPCTTIKYKISRNENVTLKIFNAVGEEISTLINEIQNPGSHSVEFTANMLPSGIYYYRIQAGSFSETKKMVVLK